MNIPQLYAHLFQELGPQHWWPGENTLEIIVGAVLTQSVAWTNVETAINKLKHAGLLTEEYLLNVSEEELGEYIRSTLYYRQKAKKLKLLFQWLDIKCGFDYHRLFTEPVGELRQEMLGQWGMGKETVDSILCYAGDLPVMVVDAYTRRILYRLGLTGEKASYDELQQFLVAGLPTDTQIYNEMHALLVRLGNLYCRNQKPRCSSCPLYDDCWYARTYGQELSTSSEKPIKRVKEVRSELNGKTDISFSRK